MLIHEDDQRDLLIYAFRYALGRSSYATGTVQLAIRFAWPMLSRSDRMLYQREIREQDEMGRDCMGMEMDRIGWMGLLELPLDMLEELEESEESEEPE